jgi:hypothetical protein
MYYQKCIQSFNTLLQSDIYNYRIHVTFSSITDVPGFIGKELFRCYVCFQFGNSAEMKCDRRVETKFW